MTVALHVAAKPAHLGDFASFHAAYKAASAGADRAERGGVADALDWAAMAGLVSSKTSDESLHVSFAPAVVAERRVKRLKRSVWASGHLHGLADRGFRPPVCWFVTLTYRGVDDWQANHISKAIKKYREWCHRIGVACRYTWVAELQHRGAVHYHLLCWLPQGRRMPQWDRTYGRKSSFWPHGMTNTQVAKSGVGYLMKYLTKLGEQSRFPKGLRLYGIGGLDQQARQVRQWFSLPEWCKAEYGVGEVVRRKVGLVVRATGEVLAPVFSCKLTGFGLVLERIRETRERFHSGAYSSVNFGVCHG